MKQAELTPLRSWGTAVRYGAAVGFSSAIVYGAVATLYIILRSSVQIIGVLTPAEGLWGTLVANALSIVWPCLVTMLLLGLLAAVIETVAFLMIYGLSLILIGQRSPFRMAAIGFVVSGILALLVNFLVVQGISAYWGAFWPMGYLFWLGLPSLIFIGTTTWLCWQGEIYQTDRRVELTRAVTGR
jgi:hypothetical protein